MTREIVPSARSKPLATFQPGAIVEVVEQWRSNGKALPSSTDNDCGQLLLSNASGQVATDIARLRLRVCGSASVARREKRASEQRHDGSSGVLSELQYSQLGGWLTATSYDASKKKELINFVPVAREATQTLLPRLVVAFVWLHQEAIVQPSDLQQLLGVSYELGFVEQFSLALANILLFRWAPTPSSHCAALALMRQIPCYEPLRNCTRLTSWSYLNVYIYVATLVKSGMFTLFTLTSCNPSASFDLHARMLPRQSAFWTQAFPPRRRITCTHAFFVLNTYNPICSVATPVYT